MSVPTTGVELRIAPGDGKAAAAALGISDDSLTKAELEELEEFGYYAPGLTAPVNATWGGF